MTFSRDKCPLSSLDFVETTVVTFIAGLGIGEGESHRGSESWQRVTDCPIGSDQPQLKRTARVLRLSEASDVETMSPDDPSWSCFRRGVVPDLGSVNLH